MDVSHKLLRLFLPIVIIGALGIGILDSILTPSPVFAYRHVDELDLHDPDQYERLEIPPRQNKDTKWGWPILLFTAPKKSGR